MAVEFTWGLGNGLGGLGGAGKWTRGWGSQGVVYRLRRGLGSGLGKTGLLCKGLGRDGSGLKGRGRLGRAEEWTGRNWAVCEGLEVDWELGEG